MDLKRVKGELNIMKKKPLYNISYPEIKYIEEHTFTMMYDDAIYWLYSERMNMFLPFLQRKKDEFCSLEDLLEYCKNQRIEVYPMKLRKRKILTWIVSYIELLHIKKLGLLIKSSVVARLIVEYSKYCIVNYPIHL